MPSLSFSRHPNLFEAFSVGQAFSYDRISAGLVHFMKFNDASRDSFGIPPFIIHRRNIRKTARGPILDMELLTLQPNFSKVGPSRGIKV